MYYFCFLLRSEDHSYITVQARRKRGARGAVAPPVFSRTVNPISTRGSRLCPPQYYEPPRIFRPCDGAVCTSAKGVGCCVQKIAVFADFQYRVGGSEKMQKLADLIYGRSLVGKAFKWGQNSNCQVSSLFGRSN